MLIEATLIFTSLLTGGANLQTIIENLYAPEATVLTLTPNQTLTTPERDEAAEWDRMDLEVKVELDQKWVAQEEARKAAEAEAEAAEQARQAAEAEEAQSDWPTPPNVTPDPGSAQAEALTQTQVKGWSQDEFNCLVSLWNKESGWNHTAMNPSSGAYGIPQSLPGNKMASAGADWQTNPATQIRWGLGYIENRYGTPCVAWQHSENNNWY